MVDSSLTLRENPACMFMCISVYLFIVFSYHLSLLVANDGKNMNNFTMVFKLLEMFLCFMLLRYYFSTVRSHVFYLPKFLRLASTAPVAIIGLFYGVLDMRSMCSVHIGVLQLNIFALG